MSIRRILGAAVLAAAAFVIGRGIGNEVHPSPIVSIGLLRPGTSVATIVDPATPTIGTVYHGQDRVQSFVFNAVIHCDGSVESPSYRIEGNVLTATARVRHYAVGRLLPRQRGDQYCELTFEIPFSNPEGYQAMARWEFMPIPLMTVDGREYFNMPELRVLLQHTSHSVREAAAEILSRSGEWYSFLGPALNSAFKNRDPRVRSDALIALLHLKRGAEAKSNDVQIDEQLFALLRTDDAPSVRALAALHLAERHTGAAARAEIAGAAAAGMLLDLQCMVGTYNGPRDLCFESLAKLEKMPDQHEANLTLLAECLTKASPAISFRCVRMLDALREKVRPIKAQLETILQTPGITSHVRADLQRLLERL